MRKVIGIGETVYDVILKNGQPVSGKPGGSVFNALVSLGRMGVNPIFISEVGKDHIGEQVFLSMKQNGVQADFMSVMPAECKSALALAFLDENEHPDYMFYTSYPDLRLNVDLPQLHSDDIILMGSFYALDAAVHDKLKELLEQAREKNAIVYYDVNFRKNLVSQVNRLMPALLENMEYATILKGSDEDFLNIYNDGDADHVYKEHMEFFTKNFIYTCGEKGAIAFGNHFRQVIPGQKVTLASTVGAGDNFNAGVIYGLLKYNITYDDLHTGTIPPEIWAKILNCGISFSSHVCTLLDNYVSPQWVVEHKDLL